MTIVNYDPAKHPQFETMLVDYFFELESDIPEHIIRGKLQSHIQDHYSRKHLSIAIAMKNNNPIGFSIYQIDTTESDWCKRPGWGCVREFYITKAHRRRGFGTALAIHSEKHLLAMGAQGLYLTADTAVPFWENCGYCNTHEICSNDLEIMAK